MSNRDYFTTPIQGSRSAHDYGRTVLHRDPPRSRWGMWIVGAVVGVAAVAFVAG